MFDKAISRVCKYDPSTDLRPADQFGFINLREAYDKGVIPGSISITDESFNGMLPDDILPRSKDIFERYRQMNYVRSALSAAADQDAIAVSMAVSPQGPQ